MPNQTQVDGLSTDQDKQPMTRPRWKVGNNALRTVVHEEGIGDPEENG
jgi:hypothetical protein